jgi:hypothetical protein
MANATRSAATHAETIEVAELIGFMAELDYSDEDWCAIANLLDGDVSTTALGAGRFLRVRLGRYRDLAERLTAFASAFRDAGRPGAKGE